MALCEECYQWYHLGCLGLEEEQLKADKDWKCGYCRGAPDKDGMCEWKMAIPRAGRKRVKVAPKRDIRDTPRARGVGPDDDDLHYVGPRHWDDIVAAARAGGKAINVKMQTMKRRAEKLVKEGGHHIVDEMAMAGIQARDVDQVLVNDLMQENLLNDDDEPEAVAPAVDDAR
jgi:hypothetical protein